MIKSVPVIFMAKLEALRIIRQDAASTIYKNPSEVIVIATGLLSAHKQNGTICIEPSKLLKKLNQAKRNSSYLLL